MTQNRVEPLIYEPFKPDLSRWDKELVEYVAKKPFMTTEPEIPEEIKFPFMMVFHRKKISQRNNNYLVGCAIMKLCDMSVLKSNLKHKGWPNMTLMFDLPKFMIPHETDNRYVSWIFQNWMDLERVLSPSDKLLVPALMELFPCPSTQVLTKKGQYKLIF